MTGRLKALAPLDDGCCCVAAVPLPLESWDESPVVPAVWLNGAPRNDGAAVGRDPVDGFPWETGLGEGFAVGAVVGASVGKAPTESATIVPFVNE